MANELYYQKKLIDWAKNAGGWGYKTSSPMVAGLCDVTLLLPKLPVVLAEVKLIDNVVHKIKITKKQIQRLKTSRDTHARVLPMEIVWCRNFKGFAVVDWEDDPYYVNGDDYLFLNNGKLITAVIESWRQRYEGRRNS